MGRNHHGHIWKAQRLEFEVVISRLQRLNCHAELGQHLGIRPVRKMVAQRFKPGGRLGKQIAGVGALGFCMKRLNGGHLAARQKPVAPKRDCARGITQFKQSMQPCEVLCGQAQAVAAGSEIKSKTGFAFQPNCDRQRLIRIEVQNMAPVIDQADFGGWRRQQ